MQETQSPPCIIIKTPSDKLPSHQVTYEQNWSVRDLKQHLCETYPTHPQPPAQRLIYAGKLLSDDTLLSTLFKNPSVNPTIHMVCRNSENTTKLSGDTTNSQSNPTNSSGVTENISSEDLQRYQQQYYEYLRSFYMQTAPSTNAHPYSFYYPYPIQASAWPNAPSGSAFAGPLPQGPFMNPMAPTGIPADADGANLAGQPFWNAMNQVNAAAPEREPVPQPAPQPPQQQQQQQPMVLGDPMAAGFMGGDGVGENGENLDIVDRFYMLFRLVLFIGLCFAYSSLDKAIIVFSVAAYVYFYNIYRRHAAVRRVAAAAVAANEPPREPAAGPPSSSESNSTDQQLQQQETVSDSQLRQRTATQTQEATAQQQASGVQPAPGPETPVTRIVGTVRLVLSTSFQFFSSLITSLIPEQPPPIRLD